ncbi:hypothetical protein J8F10_16160 [Gemmata sp. G18]|uniref:Carboxypeptidase regulatory-like domain-containing protein n=1 Tax=Gemmata palustris TaxID=2822762 RepID=A0ABS5BSV6_9BACT|nr:hypothetical protein [Gemmata palustris]MBP3956808.1 hypothetical protein [Gemmata palustris]
MRRLVALVSLSAALASGCAGESTNDGPVTAHPVTGRVIYDGKPAAGVSVILLPSDAPMVPRIPHNPNGVTKDDGTFTITTFSEGDGAAEGGYQVLLTWPYDPAELAAKGETSDEAKDMDRLMGWYDAAHTPVSVRVKPGANEIPTINIPKITRPAGAVQGIPGRN